MIYFVGNTQSNYKRGKDKTKRKSRVSPLVGAGLGTVAGGPVGTIAGGVGLAVAGGLYAAQKAKQKKQNNYV